MEKQVAFYADFNCPFCFAMNERLVGLGLSSAVEWRGLQHEPDLPIPARPTEKATAELSDELERLKTRAPEITIRKPPFRPSSGPATNVVVRVMSRDRTKADVLRTEVFRALWHEGADISDLSVLNRLLAKVGITDPSDLADLDPSPLLESWQRAWESGGFERRIPSMASLHGATMLGFQDVRRIDLFVRSGRYSAATEDACVAKDAPSDAD